MEGVRQNRSAEAIEAANSFRQGHLVEVPGLFYAANLADSIWQPSYDMAAEAEAAGDELGTELVVIDDPDLVKYGIITTQSCDVNEEFEPRRMPWLQLAPVYEAVGDHAGAESRNYTHQLRPPELDGGPWVADIRLELPVEKGYLVGRTPIEAFPSEEREIKFSKWLAEMRGRPAMASVVNELVWVKIKELIDRDKPKAKEVGRLVYSTRLGIPAGSRLLPTELQLHVVLKPGAEGENAALVEAWFGDWWDQARQHAEDAGVSLLPTQYHDADAANLEVIDALVAIRDPF